MKKLSPEPNHEGMIPLLPARRVLFRERGQDKWKQYQFKIMGDAKLVEASRSSKPMHLMLVTDIDGFRATEVVALDLFAAVASAMLTADSIIMMLQRTGEVQLRRECSFEAASDSVFFGDRIQALRQKFEAHSLKETESDDGSAI
jgi:hypothetical protein